MKTTRIREPSTELGFYPYIRQEIIEKTPVRQSTQTHSKKGVFRAAHYQGDKPRICDKLALLLRPAFGANFKAKVKDFETCFTSETHYMVENRPSSTNFIADSLVGEPKRCEQRRYEILKDSTVKDPAAEPQNKPHTQRP